MEFRILGSLEVIKEGHPVKLGGARQRALLAILLTRANEVVSTDRLIDELWGAEPPRTAANTVQYYVSQLRKLLGADRIVTQPPGYVIRLEPGELDLERFERLLQRGDADALHEALALWRGAPLADLAYEAFAQPEIARLEELRLTALERRLEADLALGRHAELVPELEALVAGHPLRERLPAHLMLALYRSGRQAEALAVYQAARNTLVEELGIEPGPALQELERAILRQDSSLDIAVAAAPPERSILVALEDALSLEPLVALAEPLAVRPARELILAAIVTAPDDLLPMTALLNERRASLVGAGVAARAAAFTSSAPGDDVIRLASKQEVDLVLLDGRRTLADGSLSPDLENIFSETPCDVGLLLASEAPCPGPDRAVLVPFGGADHDWAAVEVAAWLAGAHAAPLRLLGSAGGAGRRDASRLLASASLLVQRAVGIATEPLLVPPGDQGVVEASTSAGLIVVGLSTRWRSEGLGEARLAVARQASAPTLLVRRGPRPGGLAPQETLTRFTWSLTLEGRRS